MEKNRSKIIVLLIKKHGKKAQVMQTIEEMSELIKELLKDINRGKENREEILEEYCDVVFMLEQLKEIYGINNEEIEIQMCKKLEKVIKLLE